MKVSKSQAQGFVDAMLGSHFTSPETGEGDYYSPQVAAYLSGVLPEMVGAWAINGALHGHREEKYTSHRDRFCDLLEAVARRLRDPDGEG